MKTTLAVLLALTAAPALAHTGPHIHPHGETALPLFAGLTAIALAVFFAWRAR